MYTNLFIAVIRDGGDGAGALERQERQTAIAKRQLDLEGPREDSADSPWTRNRRY
jgi:hypothetical protein